MLPGDIQLVAHRVDESEVDESEVDPSEVDASEPLDAVVEAEEERACARYEGMLRGNDPGVTAALEVCREGDALTGTLQWQSPHSGSNVRLVAGTMHGDEMRLHDVKLLEAAPNPQWRFCTIDAYRLTVGDDGGLSGHYVSTACRDRAQVDLQPAPR